MTSAKSVQVGLAKLSKFPNKNGENESEVMSTYGLGGTLRWEHPLRTSPKKRIGRGLY